jgi:hypothetical protein
MANNVPQVNVPGLALVRVNTNANQRSDASGSAQASATNRLLGYSRNGIDITHEAFFLDVPGDYYGGDDGPPIDIQHLGEISRVRMELTKWDMDTLALIRSRIRGVAAGIINTPGRLMFAGSECFGLLISTADAGYRIGWDLAIPRMPIEENRGTKFSTLIMEWECHGNQELDNAASNQLYSIATDGTDPLTYV